MNINEILKTIKQLSGSEGLYGRLYSYLLDMKYNSPAHFAVWCQKMERQNFTDTLDLILYLES